MKIYACGVDLRQICENLTFGHIDRKIQPYMVKQEKIISVVVIIVISSNPSTKFRPGDFTEKHHTKNYVRFKQTAKSKK